MGVRQPTWQLARAGSSVSEQSLLPTWVSDAPCTLSRDMESHPFQKEIHYLVSLPSPAQDQMISDLGSPLASGSPISTSGHCPRSARWKSRPLSSLVSGAMFSGIPLGSMYLPRLQQLLFSLPFTAWVGPCWVGYSCNIPGCSRYHELEIKLHQDEQTSSPMRGECVLSLDPGGVSSPLKYRERSPEWSRLGSIGSALTHPRHGGGRCCPSCLQPPV